MKKTMVKTADHIVCSICIANFNGINFIDACIHSILNQKNSPSLEIIVHDDASTDNSVPHIKKKYPFVRLIESKENVGFCVSNNRMVEKARGENILLLNNDAVLFDDALETLYDHSLKDGCDQSILGLSQYDAQTGELIDIGSFFDLFLNAVPNVNEKRRDVGMVIGACLWIPKSLWHTLDGFPDWFHTLAEDMYLCCVARLQGYSVRTVPTSGFFHWVGSSLGGGKIMKNRLSSSINRRRLSELNKTYVMVLCFPGPVFHIVFPIHLFLLLVEGILISLLKRDIVIFKTIYLNVIKTVWKRRRQLFIARRQCQKMKKITLSKFFNQFTLTPYKASMLIKFGVPNLK